MSSGKRILLITPGFPADETDTTCIPALWTWVKAYTEHYPQDQLVVVSLHYPFRKGEYRFHGVRVVSLGGANPNGLGKIWFILDAINQVQKVIAQEKPDLVHAFWMNATAFIAWHATRGQVPLLVNIMGQDTRPSVWFTLLKRKPIRYIAPSDFSLQALKRTHPDAVAEIAHFGMSCQPAFAGDRDIDILGVGSLHAVKRFRDFIRVVEILVRRGRQLRCSMIGEGPERKLLETMISEANLSEQIHMMGKQPLESVYGLMARSRILLHPSENEGFGMVFAEALCNRMMIVSRTVGTAVPAPWWAIANNPEQMADAVERLLDAPVAVPDEALFDMGKSCAAFNRIYSAACSR